MQLRDRLEALPKKNLFSKERGDICARTQLSSVSEISEFDDVSSVSTLVLGRSGVCQRPAKTPYSDGELIKPSFQVASNNNASCLLVATVGPEDSVINDTIERLSKSKDFDPTDIVDMLAREALQAGSNNFNTKLTANTHNITQDAVNTEVIDNTPIEKTKKPLKRNVAKKSCTIVSRSTTDDESNTEAVINDTPVYSNPRKGKFGHLLRKQYASKDHKDKHKTSIRAHKTPLEPKVIVEKIGSETSEEFDTNYDLILNKQKFVHDENAVIECLNDMVSKVCKDINECLTYNPDYDVFNENRKDTNTAKNVKKTTKSKTLKLILQAKKEKAPKKASTIKARDEPNVTEQNVSVLKEVNAEKTKEKSARNKDINEKQPKSVRATPKVPLTEKETETPQIKRKRKLYSPKDEIKITNTQEEEHDDVPLYKYKNIKKTKTASIYRDLERERELHTRKSLTRKRGQVEEPLSPRTLKMNAVFDSLKTLESSEKVVQACPKTPLSIYAFNLSSESEDEVFVKKSSKMGKTTRSSRDGSTEPTKRCNIQIRKKNQKPHDDENKSKRKKPVSKTRSRTNLHIEPVNDLIDEKMRAGSAATATHKVIGKPKAKTIDIEPKLQDPPQLELIEETDAKEISKIPKRDKHSHTKHKILSNKDNKEANNTLSPLPGLVVESVPNRKIDDDTLTPAKIQKMLKIYHDNIDAVNISTNTQNTLLDNDNVIDIEENLEENQREKSKKRSNRDDRNKIIGKKPKTALNITNDVVEDFYNKELNDIISEKSIDQTDNREIDPILTYEIDEPPSPELIRQNRQIEDLNYSMVHLERGNASSKESTPEPAVRLERLSSEDISRWLPSGRTTRTSLSSQEPLVVLERLSSEDLSKWLPSQKTSETDCNSSIRDIINPECGLNQKQHETNIRKTSEKQNSQDIKTQKRKITPTVESTTISPFDINKITFEEFERMFPIPSTSKCNVGPIEKNDSQSVHNYNTRSKTKIRKSSSQESVHLKSVSHIRTKSSSLKEKIVPKTNNIILSHETDVPEHIPSNRPKTSLSKNKKSNIDSDEPKLSSTNKRTCISPIKSLEEFIMDKNNTPNSEEVQSEDDECVQTIRRLFAKKSDEPKPSSTNKRTCISPIKSLEQFIMDKNNTPNPEEVQSEDDECVQTIRRLFAKKSDEPKPSSTNKRTCISPIKSLEEFIMDKNNTPNPEEVQSGDDECVQTIRRLFAKKTVEAKTQEIQQCNTLKDMRSNSIVTQDQTKSQDSDKNKSDSDRSGRGSVLKEATDRMFTIHEPSTSRANDTFDSSKDTSHVLERNRNTIKKLLNLYTEIQVEFNIIKEEQRQFNEDRNKRLQNIYNAMMEEQRQQEKRCQEIIQKYEECLDNLKKLLADYL